MRGRVRSGARRASFTLVELLVVVGIFAILVAIAMPAFTGIGQGSRARAALTELKFTLQLARQWAVTHREDVYVVFPIGKVGSFTNVAYQAYAVCTTNEYLREWDFLSQGLLFDNRPSRAKNLHWNGNLRFSIAKLSISKQPAIVFRPDGALVTQNLDPEIYVGEGFLNGSSPVYRAANTTNSVQVYRFTGMPQVTRYDQQ